MQLLLQILTPSVKNEGGVRSTNRSADFNICDLDFWLQYHICDLNSLLQNTPHMQYVANLNILGQKLKEEFALRLKSTDWLMDGRSYLPKLQYKLHPGFATVVCKIHRTMYKPTL